MGKQCRVIHLIMESFRVAVLVSSLVLFCSVVSHGLEVRSNDDPATPCTDANCKLPDCFCSGTKAPNDIPGERVPQFIMLTFDDSINPYVHQFYEKLFNPARKNPNGCPIRGTFYVTHEWNDYWLTKKLYNEGHEIADHSITHETTHAFKNADIDRWVKEICGMKKFWRSLPVSRLKTSRDSALLISNLVATLCSRLWHVAASLMILVSLPVRTSLPCGLTL